MSNFANNEYRTVSSAGGIVLLFCSLMGICIPLTSVLVADDTDVDRAKSIIAMIQQPDAPDRNRVDEVLGQIPLHSPLRPVASQAACIVHIQQGQFADALKCLQSNPANTTSSASVQLGAQRLKLWLLLEMESNEETDAIFRNLVRVALSDRIENSEKTSLIEWLGTLIGMLQTVGQPEVILSDTLIQAKTAIETRASLSMALRFKEQWDKSNGRGNSLKACIEKFLGMGLRDAKVFVTTLEAERAHRASTLSSAKEKVEVGRKIVKDLEKDLEKSVAKRNALNREWIKLRRNAPREPDDPSNSEKEHHKRVEKEHERKLANLEDKILGLGPTIGQMRKKIEEAKRNIPDRIVVELKESQSHLLELDERVLVSRFALADVSTAKNESMSRFRPSRFDLIDDDYEESRLTKALCQP